jgi:phosphopantothenoylcysteine decarboxylase/phosphopantothenate--cysteine ligase
LLTQAGAEVDVVMTPAATEFVGGITFEAVTGRQVHSDIFAPGLALDHIKLAREANAIVVAPATADFLARAVHGNANDLLTASLLAAECPVLLVPAMNDRMWAHAQTQENVARARSLGYGVMDPGTGELAVGEGAGPGRMPEPHEILARVAALLETAGSLRGKTVIVTAGATREELDPVRFISNYSSGRMGIEIARVAAQRGAAVTLIAGHTEVALPPGVESTRAKSTADMRAAIEKVLPSADVLIMAAAPADFRPAARASEKLKKSGKTSAIPLEPTDDILLSTAALRSPKCVVVGFALETSNGLENARDKLRSKKLDLVVLNHAGEEGAGFGAETNRVTLVSSSDVSELPLMSKREVAERLLDRVEMLFDAR